jgi:hypothetical protein
MVRPSPNLDADIQKRSCMPNQLEQALALKTTALVADHKEPQDKRQRVQLQTAMHGLRMTYTERNTKET